MDDARTELAELHRDLSQTEARIRELKRLAAREAQETEQPNPDAQPIEIVVAAPTVRFEWSKLTRLFVISRLQAPPFGESLERRQWLQIMRQLGGEHWAILPKTIVEGEVLEPVGTQIAVERIQILIRFLERVLEWGAKETQDESEEGRPKPRPRSNLRPDEFAVLSAFMERLEDARR